jgi:PHD/YefM family antitoxin component YafN of YafNO toxin-antitoxin module
MTITKTREKLTTLSGSLQGNDTIAVTSRGQEVLALMRWDLYEAISETLEILGDPALMRQLKQSLREAKEGKLLSLAEVKKDLGNYARDNIHKNRR